MSKPSEPLVMIKTVSGELATITNILTLLGSLEPDGVIDRKILTLFVAKIIHQLFLLNQAAEALS